MQKLMFMTGVTVIVCVAIFAWSHSAVVPVQARSALSINPTDMMHAYKPPLPIEQWDAI
jgi:hypothetical protein